MGVNCCTRFPLIVVGRNSPGDDDIWVLYEGPPQPSVRAKIEVPDDAEDQSDSQMHSHIRKREKNGM